MKLADFVCTAAIRENLAPTDKPGLVRELVGALSEAGKIPPKDVRDVTEAVLRREHIGSTALGRGIAVPHAMHKAGDRLVATVGIGREGLDFNSLDSEWTHLFFLLLSPPDRHAQHIAALQSVSQQVRDQIFCKFLLQAKTAKDVVQVLEEADEK